ncbi:MAG: A/G-specific adenine glycosylase [Bacteroidales bacterium]
MEEFPISPAKKAGLQKTLLEWYSVHQRDLPWRISADPYRIWLSEVILQQTRVDQGLEYYRKLTARYPDVQSLAASTEDELLKHWQGLGYYSRARNLLRAARIIKDELGGRFPHNREQLLHLPGIGPYTSAAIASIAFSEPVAAVDGNVQRVISRLFAVSLPIDSPAGKNRIGNLADELLVRSDPGTFNQALMEFGALQCVPARPLCAECPVREFCMARQMDLTAHLPVKSGKTKQRKRFFNYLFVRTREGILMQKRLGKDIWEGLYEFPLIETAHNADLKNLMESEAWEQLFGNTEIQLADIHGPVIHQLSHQQIHTVFYELQVKKVLETDSDNLQCVREDQLINYPVPVLLERYLTRWKEKQDTGMEED